MSTVGADLTFAELDRRANRLAQAAGGHLRRRRGPIALTPGHLAPTLPGDVEAVDPADAPSTEDGPLTAADSRWRGNPAEPVSPTRSMAP